MESVLRGLLWEKCLVYIDDIICFGRTFEETLANLELVFARLSGANLSLKAKKCFLFKRELLYLGFVISGQGVRCDPSKLDSLREWEEPTNVSELRAFLGFVNYHRRFLPKLADVAESLTCLLK